MCLARLLIRSRASTIFCALSALFSFAAILPLPAHAFTITVVKSADLKPYQEALRGLRAACNCDVQEVKPQDGDVAGAVFRRSSAAVMAIGTGAFRKVKTIGDLPLVYAMVMPSEAASAAGPNISGVRMDASPERYLSTMKDLFPEAKRIGMLYDPSQTGLFADAAESAARAAGIELVRRQVLDPRKIPALLEEMRNKIDVFWMLPDETVVTPETVELLLRFSFQYRVPVFSFSRKYVDMGAVASLDVDPYDMGVQAGEIVRKLKAGRSGPVLEWARTAHLTINAKVAAKLGLKFTPDILQRAEERD